MEPSQNLASPPMKTSFFTPNSDKPSILSPRKHLPNKSIKFALDLNPEPINSIGTRNSRNSSFFQPLSAEFYNEGGGASSPSKRKRNTSISINKLMIRLKMGINSFNSGNPNSYHRTLIDQLNQLNEIKKDKDSSINSLDNYSKEELLAVILCFRFFGSKTMSTFFAVQDFLLSLLKNMIFRIKKHHPGFQHFFFF